VTRSDVRGNMARAGWNGGDGGEGIVREQRDGGLLSVNVCYGWAESDGRKKSGPMD
jgi:hypothetical protein